MSGFRYHEIDWKCKDVYELISNSEVFILLLAIFMQDDQNKAI
jgi:hypothetical protein